MIWFFNDPARYQAEADAIATLESNAPWLKVQKWGFGDGACLICEADISVGDHVFPVTLRYNHGFPSVPPSVLPRTPERWSNHQYGNGELCLEYGPDNWVPELQGAAQLTSAHRLLDGELTAPDQEAVVPVPSRHSLTLGQELRGKSMRFLNTVALQVRMNDLGEITRARFGLRIRNNVWMAYPTSFWVDDVECNDPQVPTGEVDRTEFMEGFIVRKPEGIGEPQKGDATEFRQNLLGDPEDGSDPSKDEFLLFLTNNGLRAFYLWGKGNVVFEFPVTIESKANQRLESSYVALAGKKVGLIGCGSIGSKTAATLARAGVGHFVLIDDDILLPENLVRNDLDWSSVGEHKALGLARRLRLINPVIVAETRQHRIGGQEASMSLGSVMAKLASCDLIIDATADGNAFNLAVATAIHGDRPMLWAEVFAGGIGGAIARSRPGIDPTPQEARKRLIGWYQQQEIMPPAANGIDYGGGTNETPLIADDSDVSVIASHLGQMAIDTLLARSPSRFPYSAYVIGLQVGWIFEQPFDTYPINLGSVETVVVSDASNPKWQEGIDGLSELLKGISSASANNT